MSAMAAASSPGCAASTTERPLRPLAISSEPFSAIARHASVVGAGRSTSRSNASRAGLPGPSSGCQSRTSLRVTPMPPSSFFRPYCGWPGSSSFQLSSSRSRSRPGRITDPFGRFAMTRNRLAVAGMEPVEPAAITGPCGGCFSRRAASAASMALRRVLGSIAPSASRIAGQFWRTMSRNSQTLRQ